MPKVSLHLGWISSHSQGDTPLFRWIFCPQTQICLCKHINRPRLIKSLLTDWKKNITMDLCLPTCRKKKSQNSWNSKHLTKLLMIERIFLTAFHFLKAKLSCGSKYTSFVTCISHSMHVCRKICTKQLYLLNHFSPGPLLGRGNLSRH